MIKRLALLNLCLILAFPAHTLAEDLELHSESHALGTWLGAQEYLLANGISADAVLTYDLQGTASGGIERRAGQLGNVDLTFAVDTEKAGLWSNGTFFMYVLGDMGDDPSEAIGEFQAVNNIQSPDALKIYEAWYDHSLFDGDLSALVGLYDYNSEFYSLDYAGTLINSSFGIGPDVAQVTPSIFPTTSLALRLKAKIGTHAYGMAAVLDGVPGDPNNYRGTHINLKRDDGLFLASEFGVIEQEGQPHYKYALGTWYHTARYEDYEERERNRNFGLYTIGETTVFNESDTNQGLGFFYQLGFAAPNRNRFTNYIGTGLSYTGLIPNRDEDVTSIGIGYFRLGSAARGLSDEQSLAELMFEATYRIVLNQWLSLQPDLQIIHNPDASTENTDAVVLGLRTEIAL